MPDFDEAQYNAYLDGGGDSDNSGVAAESRHFANAAGAAEAHRRLKEAEARIVALEALNAETNEMVALSQGRLA